MGDFEHLEALLRARHACVSIVSLDETYVMELISAAALSLDVKLNVWSSVRGLRGGMVEGSRVRTGTENAGGALFAAGTDPDRQIVVMLDLSAHLGDATTLRSLRELVERFEQTRSTLVLVDHADPPAVVRSIATPFDVGLPDETELRAIVKRTFNSMRREAPLKSALTESGFGRMVQHLVGLSRAQVKRVVMDALLDDFKLDDADLPRMLAAKRQILHADGLLEYVERLESMEHIGGLDVLKRWLEHRRLAMTDDAIAFGIEPPRGVLLLGVQGAGKSLCAKAIATAWERPLLRMDPSVLYDRFVGESERRLREALMQAEAMSPIVLWIDEIEKGFASAASHSIDGGLSQRMFGTLLTWMQEHTKPVFLVATANDIEALPPELLRKGRFDEIFFVDLPGEAARREIVAIHLKRRGRDLAAFDLDRLAAASAGYSGAEIEQAIVSALHEAYATKGEIDTDGVERALSASPPLSVTMREKIEELRAWAQGRCVMAG
jgi:SpoVK/Ycf46/Vps4 family AAA+-type ATPase